MVRTGNRSCTNPGDESYPRRVGLFDNDTTYAEKKLSRRGIDPRKERDLISLLKVNEDGFMVCNAFEMLQQNGIGTKRCVPALKKICLHKKEDVQTRALSTIQQFSGRAEIDFYREVLSSTDYRVKRAAVDAVVAFGDESDVEAMTNRLKVLVAKKRGDWIGDTELSEIARFLEEFVEHNDVARNGLNYLRAHFDRLGSSEIVTIQRCSPTLSPKREWVVLILPDIDGRERLKLVYSWIGKMGMYSCSPSDARFASAMTRWLPISKHVVVFGADTAKKARAASAAIRKRAGIVILPVPAYFTAHFETFREFLESADAEEKLLRKKVRALCVR